ncbi:MAG: glutamate racemase [Limnochordia bacterium]|jgi:glutamate racemase
MAASSPLGVYDSGVGGLTVVRQLRRQLPREQIIYLADTARLPYGNREPEEIITFARQIITFLVGQGVKLILIACNTSSALALPLVEKEYTVPLVGMIQPGVQQALQETTARRIGVMATEATVKSGAYEQALHERGEKVQVFSQACPLFVPLIEGGLLESPQMDAALGDYLEPLRQQGIDTLIYGCTHYPFLDSQIKARWPGLRTIDPAESAVARGAQILKDRGQLAMKKSGPDLFLTTGSAEEFAQKGAFFLGEELGQIQSVILPKL